MSKCVDVIIPCYQYGCFLRDCVDSVLSQEGVEVRVLVIDDASTDNTAEIAKELSKHDSRVEFRRHHTNQGHISTYNEGIDWVSADYMLLLSADDMMTPGALLRAVTILDSHPQVGMSYGLAVYLRGEVRHSSLPIMSSEWQIVRGNQFLDHVFSTAYQNPVPTPTAIVRTELQKKLGGYRHDLSYSGDLEMWIRFALHSDVCVIKACQAFYRIHEKNMSLQYRRLGALAEYKRTFDVIFDTYSNKICKAKQLRHKTDIRLAEIAFWQGSRAFESGDIDSCNAYLEFAESIYPDIKSSKSWKRLRYKRLLGSVLWSKLGPLIGKGERRFPRAEYQNEAANILGWWPEPAYDTRESLILHPSKAGS